MTPTAASASGPGVLSLLPAVTLEVWADLTCPWCYIGSRRLALALAHESDGSVLVRWRSMDCDVDAGAHSHSEVTEAGREVGIVFDERGSDLAEASLAQRAVLLYDEDPRQRAVAAALFGAHFEHGENIADLSVVVSAVAMAAEDDTDSIRERLVSGEGEDRLVADRLQAHLMGIIDLPAYVATGRIVLQGDQSIEQLRRLVAHGRELEIV